MAAPIPYSMKADASTHDFGWLLSGSAPPIHGKLSGESTFLCGIPSTPIASNYASSAVYEVGSQAPFRHLIAFSVLARTVHAHDRPVRLRVLASSVLAFFLPRRSPLTLTWGRAAGQKECSVSADASSRETLLAKALLSAGVFHGPSSSPGQPSIRVTPATGATTF